MKNIFLHIPKTAGQSMRHALKKCQNLVDLEHTSVFGNPYYFNNVEQEVFSFCFIRNPYTRILSSFFHLTDVPDEYLDHENGLLRRRAALKKNYGNNFNDFILSERFKILDFEHFFPMTYFLSDAHGDIPISYIGRYESLAVDFAVLAEKLNLSSGLLPAFNKTGVPEYEEYKHIKNWDLGVAELIKQFYSLDFLKLGYSTDLNQALVKPE